MGRTKGPRGYRTSKDARTLAGECQSLLAEFGAKSVHVKYDDGEPDAIAFVLESPSGDIPFRFDPNVAGVARRMDEGGYSNDPRAVAWFQTCQLIEIVLEFHESRVATAVQLLAGMAVNRDGRTLSDMLEDRPGDLMTGGTLFIDSGR